MTPADLIARLRKLNDKCERGVSYGFEQTIWSETADALTAQAERIAMTTEIPKRPEPYPYEQSTPERWLAHEHAVARVAVEALREATYVIRDCCAVKPNSAGEKSIAQVHEALAKIEASGWRP